MSTSVETKEIQYNGKSDEEKIIAFLNWINEKLKIYQMPKNLYSFTTSPLDIVLTDFKGFNIKQSIVLEEGICSSTIMTIQNDNTAHMVIRPNSLLKVSFEIDVASKDSEYNFLKIYLCVNSL